MFARLFAEAGLSLDRLRALVDVGAAGSIAKAAEGDPIKQSQYSRQIKELEDFFRTTLIERQGRGIRLTAGGKELARISRFFLLGLSNFQRGCLAEEQTFRLGASATFIDRFLLPILANARPNEPGPCYALETVGDAEIERRLHDLTLDFGVVTAAALSRPLQMQELGSAKLRLWVPKSLHRDEADALLALKDKRLRLVWATNELSSLDLPRFKDCEPRLSCSSFVEARAALESEGLAAVLPDFMVPKGAAGALMQVRLPASDLPRLHFRLAWNPRLLRLNPHAVRRRDALIELLAARMRKPS